MTESNSLRSVLVQGRLAFAMRRVAGARRGEIGLQIFTLPQLGARLAGGLLRPASRESIEAGIRRALVEPGLLLDIAPIANLPGVTRAVMGTLRNVWRSGYDLRSGSAADHPRARDLIRIEDFMRAHLPQGELLPPDLCAAARASLATASWTIGPLHIEGVHAVDRLWRDLINDLRSVIRVTWSVSSHGETGWFLGRPETIAPNTAIEHAFSCADPAHEALEAMRWARELIASGRARPEEIAISATSTSRWDDAMLALANASKLPISFVGGRPALAGWDGQRCAALADILNGGLSQARLRRLLSLTRGQGTPWRDLSSRDLPVSTDASLSTADDWALALQPQPEIAAIVVPVLRVLESGTEAAVEAASLLLRGRARELWDRALRVAPATALMFSLSALRVPDDNDPAGAIAWCSAEQLASAPRPYVWLMGLTTTDWPRTGGLDPILPEYIVPAREFTPDPSDRADRRSLAIIRGAAREVMLSTTRRTSAGTRAAQSPLLPAVPRENILYRDQAGRHPLSESDRLLARTIEARSHPIIASGLSAWTDWRAHELTAHDGLVNAPHPLLSILLEQPQSPTSLSLLLRDPLAYGWYYALGWRDLVHKERPLILPPDDYGRLTHELLRRSVDELERGPGFTRAQDHEKDEALEEAVVYVTAKWPEEFNVPPPMLWKSTVRQAADMAAAGLKFEGFREEGTRSWTEVPFGQSARDEGDFRELPWDPTKPVTLKDSTIRITGTIDRLDLRAASAGVRVTDYKTGAVPDAPDQEYIGHGANLQRVLYALACQQLLEEMPIVTRLIYLRPPARQQPMKNYEHFIALVSAWVIAAGNLLQEGKLFPDPSVFRGRDRFGRIALPASSSYLARKDTAIRQLAGRGLTQNWRQK